jgi:hypothetical protein
MCRGTDCIAWATNASDKKQTASLGDRCFYLGSPTGIGIFNQRQGGRIARKILATEYIWLGREFLYLEPRDVSKPIIVIDANRHLIDFPSPTGGFCNREETTLTFDRATDGINVAACPNGFERGIGGRTECRIADAGAASGTDGSP